MDNKFRILQGPGRYRTRSLAQMSKVKKYNRQNSLDQEVVKDTNHTNLGRIAEESKQVEGTDNTEVLDQAGAGEDNLSSGSSGRYSVTYLAR
jgi:hypothetical protein